jgi:HD-GYP domain-containing protein (c-di-GMP phosphodiesterase class II)
LNGSGYPEGVEGEDIPLIARIIAVADSFIAATSSRPYRKALSTELALEMIGKVTGTILDENVYNILVKIVANQTEQKP